MTTLTDETSAPIEDVAPVPGSFNEGRTVPAPAGYTDSFEDRGRLLLDVWSKHGPGWQVSHIGDKIHLVDGVPPYRPAVRYAILSDKASRADGQRLNEALQASMGLSLVQYNAPAHRAVVAALPPYERRLRARIAKHLRIDPWALDLRTTWAPGEDDTARLDMIDIDLHEHLAMDSEKAEALFQEIARKMVDDGGYGWTVEADHKRDRFTLQWGPSPKLLDLVTLETLLPQAVSPEEWSTIPIGRFTDGTPAVIDLLATPHSLVVGATGAGKTIQMLTYATGALTRGWQVALLDPMKGGLDFMGIQSRCVAWAETIPETARAMEMAYAEVTRRKAILKRYGVVKIADLTLEQRAEADMHPLLVMVDEWGSTLQQADNKVVKILDESDERRIEFEQENADKALIAMYGMKISKEARYVGVHLVIANQTAHVDQLGGGAFRTNLTASVQLVPPKVGVSAIDLGMIFGQSQRDSAFELVNVLEDGRPGFALIAADGGSVSGLRVAYANQADLPSMLDRVGVPVVETQWDLTPVEDDRPKNVGQPWSTSRNGAARKKGNARREEPRGYNPYVRAAFDNAGAVPWETGGPVESPPADEGWVSAPTAEWDMSAMREPVTPEDE